MSNRWSNTWLFLQIYMHRRVCLQIRTPRYGHHLRPEQYRRRRNAKPITRYGIWNFYFLHMQISHAESRNTNLATIGRRERKKKKTRCHSWGELDIMAKLRNISVNNRKFSERISTSRRFALQKSYEMSLRFRDSFARSLLRFITLRFRKEQILLAMNWTTNFNTTHRPREIH